MENSIKWRNISVILKFFYNDSVQGLFTRPFFSKKRNRYLLGLLLVIAYVFYFYLNLHEFLQVSEGIEKNQPAQESLLGGQKIMVIALVNMTLIFCVILFVFVNSTIAINRNSLYFAKILPFSPREISISRRIFNLSAAMIFFELIFIIILPSLKIIPVPIFTVLLFMAALHVLFVAGFLALSLLYCVVINSTSLRWRALVSSCLDFLLFIIAMVYFFEIKFPLEMNIAQRSWEIAPMIAVVLAASAVLLGLSLYGVNKITDDTTYHRAKFLYFGRLRSHGFSLSILPIVRSKEFIYFVALICVVAVIGFMRSSFQETLQTLVMLVPCVGIAAVSYGDGTGSARKMYPLLRISPVHETGTIFLSAGIIMSPLLMIGWFATRSVEPFFFGVCVFVSAVISGLLFPKEHSNLNEAVSVTLTLLIIVVLAVVVNMSGFSVVYAAIAVLAVMLLSVLHQERAG